MDSEHLEKVLDVAASIAARAEEIDEIIVVYSKKSGGVSSVDNGLTVSEANLILDGFKFWLLSCVYKMNPREKS